ncbi:hypothetical protein Nepgr_027477 [Nepenthes gracilis]|uniref:Uncharacterized protein n=1 Tax=Nepenthes gracilis TaxID=150966 RepID=A0AAD3Y354_NEPGR|nr:hypothetical protein Nepgr_027477 [Nepenthes gracilis]
MGSKGRIPPHMRRSHPGLGMVYSEPFASAIRPPPGGLPPFELLPPPEIMEQKLAAQHVEMERHAAENQRCEKKVFDAQTDASNFERSTKVAENDFEEGRRVSKERENGCEREKRRVSREREWL